MPADIRPCLRRVEYQHIAHRFRLPSLARAGQTRAAEKFLGVFGIPPKKQQLCKSVLPKSPSYAANFGAKNLSCLRRSRHTPTLRSTRVHVVVIVSTPRSYSHHLATSSSSSPSCAPHGRTAGSTRSGTMFPLLACSYYLCSMHSSAQVPLLHRRAPTESLFDI